MNWKVTLGLAVVCSILGGVYYFSSDHAGDGRGTEIRIPVPPIDQIARINIIRAGKPEIVLEQMPDPITGIKWRITKPIERLANEPFIIDMVQGLKQLRLKGGIAKGDARYDLAKYGLVDPTLTVGVTDNVQKVVFKFGVVSTIEAQLRYFMLDGDDTIYLGETNASTAFDKNLVDIRNKALCRFEAFRAEKVEFSSRFERFRQVIGADGKPVEEIHYICAKDKIDLTAPGKCESCKAELKAIKRYKAEKSLETETSVIEFRDAAGLPRGWYLVLHDGKPADEHLDDTRVTQAITNLGNLICHQFVEGAKPEEYGLDNPVVTWRVKLKNVEKPVEIALSTIDKVEDGKTVRKFSGRISGNDEIGFLDERQYGTVYKQLNPMRSRVAFDIPRQQILSITIDNTISKLTLAAQAPKGTTPAPPVWIVTEPKPMLAISSDELAVLVDRLLSLEIKEWRPPQEDLKFFRLEPPELTMTFEVRRSADVVEKLVYKFGGRGLDDAFLLRPNVQEICEIAGDYLTTIDRVDLLARNKEMFHCTRKDIFEIVVDMKQQGVFAPVFYMLKRKGEEWVFGNKEMESEAVFQDQVSMLLAAINYIEGESYVTRRPEFAIEHKLAGASPPGYLRFKYRVADGVREVQLNFSAPQQAAGGGEVYYAKFEAVDIGSKSDDPFFQIVFRPRKSLVDLMRYGVKKNKGADEGTDPIKRPDKGHGDHDDHGPVWTCPSHPDVRAESAGSCPNCKANLIQKQK